jgi:hypothetical protein
MAKWYDGFDVHLLFDVVRCVEAYDGGGQSPDSERACLESGHCESAHVCI